MVWKQKPETIIPFNYMNCFIVKPNFTSLLENALLLDQ